MTEPTEGYPAAVSDDPALMERLRNAVSPEERAQILRAAGMPVPERSPSSETLSDLEDVSGAGTSTASNGALLRLVADGAQD